jgi:hypothetical protein
MNHGDRWLAGVRYRPVASAEHLLETSEQGEHLSEVALSLRLFRLRSARRGSSLTSHDCWV